MAKITDLSIEVVFTLFDYFDLNTLLKVRQTSKRLKYLVEQVRLKSLCVNNEHQLTYSNYDCEMNDVHTFFYTHESLKKCHYFQTWNSEFFKSNIMTTLLCKLKKLYIRTAPFFKEKSFSIEKNLNQLKNLEQLQIFQLSVRKNNVLSLPKLKILRINDLYTTHGTFEIDCPVLFAFKTGDKISSLYNFKHPESITYLALKSIDNSLEPFTNLECVLYKQAGGNSRYLPELKEFKNFKEINFMKEKKDVLDQILEQKVTNKLEFKIYYGGLNVETGEEIEAFSKTIDSDDANVDKSQFIALNYAKTSEENKYVMDIDYQVLTTTFSNVPDNFVNKFKNLFKVKVSPCEKGVNQEKFVDFIRKNNKLRVLDLDVSFDQTFYDNLRFYCPLLNSLDVKETKAINIDFLADLKRLQSFKINQLAPIDKIRNLYDILDTLYYFTIVRNGQIMKFRGNYYSSEDGIESFFNVNDKEVLFKDLECMIRVIRNLEGCRQEKMEF